MASGDTCAGLQVPTWYNPSCTCCLSDGAVEGGYHDAKFQIIRKIEQKPCFFTTFSNVSSSISVLLYHSSKSAPRIRQYYPPEVGRAKAAYPSSLSWPNQSRENAASNNKGQPFPVMSTNMYIYDVNKKNMYYDCDDNNSNNNNNNDNDNNNNNNNNYNNNNTVNP